MNKSSFLANFRMVVNAPGGVRRLRELVLTLAIRGELVHSEKVEEDGQALLARIISERELLVSNGDVSYASESSIAPEASLPFTIPQTWTTASLGQLSAIVRGVTFPASAMQRVKREDVVVCLKTSNVQDEIDWENLVYIAPDLVKREDQWLRVGDIVMSMANSRDLVGKVAIVRRVPTKAAIGGFLGILRPILVLPEYLFVVLRSTYIQELLRQGASQTTNIANVSLAKLRPTAVPLPPLEEQKRIVAKVDELMRLCDRLQAQQQEREKLLPLLSRANHTRFVTEPTDATLHPIFGQIGKVSPDDLRGTVFQLAVMGRLCKRIESEGDTESLLDMIFQARQQQAGESGVRISSPLADVDSSPQSPPIPKHWRWVRLGNLTAKIGSGSTPRGGAKVYVSSGVPFLRSQNIWDDGILLDDVAYITPETHQRMRSTHVSPNDILLNITGASLGRCAKVPSDFATANVSQHVTIIRPVLSETRHFLHICLLSPFGQGMIWDRQVGMAREGLSKKVLEQFEIPLPPLEEQLRIVQRVEYLLDLINRLSEKKSASAHIAQLFAMAAVATITSTEFTENERMKPPKTEVVTALKVGKKPKKPDAAPLATLLSEQKAEASAKSLWQLSGLEIDAFYRQLKTEMANGWIEEDKHKRAVQEVEAR